MVLGLVFDIARWFGLQKSICAASVDGQTEPVGRVPARGKRYTLRIFLLPVGLRVVIQEFKMPVQFSVPSLMSG